MKMKYPRRQFFVKKEFQGKFVLLYAMTVTIIAVVTTYLLHARLNDAVNRLFFSSHLQLDSTADIVYSELFRINVIAVVLIAAGTIGISLYVFHRLNAHFRRVEHVFDRMAEGRYDPSPLPASRINEISQFVKLVEDVRDTCSQRTAELADIAGQLRNALEHGAEAEELERLHGRLEGLLEKVRLPETGSDRG